MTFMKIVCFFAKIFGVKTVFLYFPMLDEEDVYLRKIILHTAPEFRRRSIAQWANCGVVNLADCGYDWRTFIETVNDLMKVDLALTRGRLVKLTEDGVRMTSRRVEVDKYMVALYNYAFEE